MDSLTFSTVLNFLLNNRWRDAQVAEYISDAKKGSPSAQRKLGEIFLKRQDLNKGIYWTKKAAEQGDHEAQWNLGSWLLDIDPEQAVGWFQKCRDGVKTQAEAGNPEAQYALGFMYFAGVGLTQNFSAAVLNFEKAANQGNSLAKHKLGSMYHSGDGVEQNFSRAKSFFRSAAEQGYTLAQYDIGMLYLESGVDDQDDLMKAVSWLQMAADQGLAIAKGRLGLIYLSGEGVKSDKKTAEKLLSNAVDGLIQRADIGNADAQHILGTMFISGAGVPYNFQQASKYYHMAASQGDTDAQMKLAKALKEKNEFAQAAELYSQAASKQIPEALYEMGCFHARGIGVQKNTNEAARLLKSAAALGHVQAKLEIAQLYLEGSGADQDFLEAASWISQAANSGLVDAQFQLGELHLSGQGVKKSKILAHKFFNLASACGHTKARQALESIAREMTLKEIEEAQLLAEQSEIKSESP